MERTETSASGHLRIVAALSIAALVIAGAMKFSAPPAPSIIIARPTMQDLTSNYIPETDSDGDGVPDWQELLDGTDPHDAKSFVAAGATTTQPLSLASASSSLTQKINDQLVAQYYTLQQSGYSDERANEIGQSIINNIRVLTPFTPYTENDLTVRNDNSAIAVSTHRLAVQAALKPLLGMTQPEATLYGAYLEDHDVARLDELSQRAEQYRSAAHALARIPTPSDLANTELATINAFSFYASVLDRMVAQVNDPIASLALLSVYNRSESFVETALNQLTALYRAKLATT